MRKKPQYIDVTEAILHQPDIRRRLAYESHEYFFAIYLSDYLTCGLADFHREMFSLTQDPSARFVAITGFRGCGKSTIMTTSYPLWAIAGALQMKFILIITQTTQQAAIIMENLRGHLEGKFDPLLKEDFGPFQEGDGPWRSTMITIPRFGAKIVVASIEQNIRSIRFGAHRPDLVIMDDIEDLASVQTLEGRDWTYQRLVRDVIPAADTRKARYFVVGNLLHGDGIMMRLKKELHSGKRDGVYREYPLLDEEGLCLWPSMYPTKESVEGLKRLVGDEAAFLREYLLRIVNDQNQVIWREWIHFWETLPPPETIRLVITGIDLAISQRETADFTAMVSLYVCGYEENFRIYVLPHAVNKRFGFRETINEAKAISWRLGNDRHPTKLLVENVAYQLAAIEEMRKQGLPVEGVQVMGQDKRARLMTVSHLVRENVLFAPQGNEALIEQLVGFGSGHDDLADAFTLAVMSVMGMRKRGLSFADLKEINDQLRKGPRNPYLPDHSSDRRGPLSFGNILHQRF